jgi:hypothetical protein
MAKAADDIFRTKYSTSDTRDAELGIYEQQNAAAAKALRSKYGADALQRLTWSDFAACPLIGGGGKYPTRKDLAQYGYAPTPLIGGKLLAGRLPTVLTSRVPIWGDRILNPDLFVVAFVVLLVLVLLGGYAVVRHYRRRARVKAQLRAVSPSDPDAHWKRLVLDYEAEGYDMTKYREYYHMGAKNSGGHVHTTAAKHHAP